MVSQNAIVAAFSSTALISLAPNVLLLLFPQFASGGGHNSRVLSLGQALAAGGLLGDVFLHVVPHSGGDHDVGLWILLGFSVFLFTDMVLRSMGGGGHGHDHGHKKDDDEKCEAESSSSPGESKASTILLNLTADALHNVSRQTIPCLEGGGRNLSSSRRQ
jgi:zinc transporter 7